MIVRTAKGNIHYMVLIPSRGRPEILAKSLRKMPFLNSVSVLFGIEKKESDIYRKQVLERLVPQARHISYVNDKGSVAVAREQLRAAAIRHKQYDRFVVTDDNAVYTRKSLDNLVRASAEWPTQPCIMAGAHSTAPHFDRHRIADSSQVISGLTSYANVGMIFQVYPRQVFEDFQYPFDSYGLDDRYFALWLIDQGVRDFRICLDAPFTKSRYQGTGGQGTTPERAWKCGKGIARLASDFPAMVGATGTLRIPWQLVFDMKGGKVPDRLAGGAMRSERKLKDIGS